MAQHIHPPKCLYITDISGAEIMLDVGLYRLDQRVACQRIDIFNRCKIY